MIKKNIKLFLSIFLISDICSNICSNIYYSDVKIGNFINEDNIAPIAIIGSGPAGLTAALYGARGGMHTVVFTGDLLGGQLTQTDYLENWPGIKKVLGSDIIDGLIEQVKEFKVQIVEDNIVKVDFSSWPFILSTESGKEVKALSVIIATGAAPRRLGIKGELEYWAKGVSSCAICDCHFFKDKDVAIVGGGDSAVEEAMQLSPYAKNIFILIRDVKMKATKSMKDRLDEFENVKVIYNKKVLEVLGDGEKVTGLEIEDLITNNKEILKVNGLFLAIGQNPNTDLFSDYLKLNNLGYISIDPTTHETSVTGVFAAGDVEDSEYRQAVVAAASGCKAALRVVKWLREIGLTDKAIKKLSKNYFNYLN